MNYYLAPLEGITGYIFRNAIHDLFGMGVTKYYTPFFTPHTKRTMNQKEMNDVRPDHNEGLYLVPQILTNNAQDFLAFERDMHEMGYEEVNINLGCPSNTVANKGRGSGFLAKPEELRAFLDTVFAQKTGRVSVKTRLGMHAVEEFERILEIYNQYEMEELIIHARIRQEFYRGKPHHEAYLYAAKNSKNPLCYNGDIFDPSDEAELFSKLDAEGLPHPQAIMAGRGALRNPAIFRELSGGAPVTAADLRRFLDRIEADYASVLSGDTNVLYRLKEIWNYMIDLYPNHEKQLKMIRKSRHLSEYRIAAAELLSEEPAAVRGRMSSF